MTKQTIVEGYVFVRGRLFQERQDPFILSAQTPCRLLCPPHFLENWNLQDLLPVTVRIPINISFIGKKLFAYDKPDGYNLLGVPSTDTLT